MSSRPFERPLLPVPSAVASPVGNTIRPRVKKASLACTECRKRKSKATRLLCVGLPPPCERCRRLNTECILDEESDRRRRGVLERRLDALEQDRTLLVRLVDSIRDGSQEEASRVLSYIRSDASLDDIRHYLSQSSSPADSEHVPKQRFNPLYRVPAWPWTSVTDDSNYISHLISLYFSWNSPVQKWIDRDLFIRDMQSGNKDSQFCSPFLVNAVLAVACCYCDISETSYALDVALPGKQDFHDEAKRLLDQEEDKLSLTSFQGRCELYLSTWIMGKHMLGWQYLVDVADCARQLMTRRNAISLESDKNAIELLYAFDTAITGSFSALSIAYPSLHKQSNMPKPTTYNLLPPDHNPKDVWWPYTVDDGSEIMPVPVPAHSNCVSAELFKLQLVLWEISNNPFQSIEQLCSTKEEMADVFHERLKQWALELPECLTQASLVDITPIPAVLNMHAVINIYDGIKILSDGLSPINKVQAMRLSSARTICSLLEIFVSRWSVIYMPFIYIRYANIALSILLADLDNSESRGHFISSYTALHTLSIRFPIAKEVLQLILEQARQLQTDLPGEILCMN
ncbi:putative Zn(II)2Cys6 transcription factor [Aspergillus mulundensis]|uniref:Putative Zn(II)2Cys6 transcription factor n=1 Tax=Aspergillus mulundensis TaxID=1810919 RepID=A0A3D8SWC2_9EURO|nr:putative Zn(II)2Cys6 transcription factor [Aspergillus mulundensis]RDW90603.1 putative Zn(II)2Cys6 transcription factor [Aspergillus mulundensis]